MVLLEECKRGNSYVLEERSPRIVLAQKCFFFLKYKFTIS